MLHTVFLRHAKRVVVGQGLAGARGAAAGGETGEQCSSVEGDRLRRRGTRADGTASAPL